MTNQGYQDDGMIPPPPPPPMGDMGGGTYDPYAAQGGQQDPQAQYQYDQGQGQQGGYQAQYDPNFAHAPYDPSQAQQQTYADPYAQQAGGQYYDPAQQAQAAQGGGQYDPFAMGDQSQATGMPPGGFDPMMGPPMGGDDGSAPPPGAPPAPPKPSKPANFQLGTKFGKTLSIKIPKHNLNFDESYFMRLLAGSISLRKDEKQRIIDSLPKLRQSQVDELIRIFEEEKEKFAELGEEHVPQLEKLAAQHYEDWVDIEMSQQQQSKASDDEAQAEEIRKQLGI